jgi:hypothetical protein
MTTRRVSVENKVGKKVNKTIRYCDVFNAWTDGARKAYARGPRSERHSSREESEGRSYRSRLMYFRTLVDQEYSA